MIDRSKTRDTPSTPVAFHEAALLFGTPVADTILASAHVRAHRQAGHMDASDLIKALQNTLRGRDRSHMELGSNSPWICRVRQRRNYPPSIHATRLRGRDAAFSGSVITSTGLSAPVRARRVHPARHSLPQRFTRAHAGATLIEMP